MKSETQIILQILYSEHSETKIIKAIEVSSQQLLFINITMFDLTFSGDIFRSQTSENRFGQRPNDICRQMCVVGGNHEGKYELSRKICEYHRLTLFIWRLWLWTRRSHIWMYLMFWLEPQGLKLKAASHRTGENSSSSPGLQNLLGTLVSQHMSHLTLGRGCTSASLFITAAV